MSEDSKGNNRRRAADPNFTPAGIDLRATNSLPHGYKVRECGRRNPNQGAKDKTVKRTNVCPGLKLTLQAGCTGQYKSVIAWAISSNFIKKMASSRMVLSV